MLALGMSYEDYWHGDPYLVLDYIEAENLRRKRQDEIAWLQGLYFYEALCCASPLIRAFCTKGTKALPYSEKPHSHMIDDEKEKCETEEEREQREEQEALQARVYMSNMMREMKNWGMPQ